MQKKCFYDTRAVLEGRQTMFRMEVKCPSNAFGFRVMRNGVGDCFVETYDDDERPIGYIEPRYRVGEIVAIAQPYKDTPATKDFFKDADFLKKYKWTKGWSNKMFVKPDLMPHHIKITNIKVERLQDISKEDCLKEGIGEAYLAGVGKWHYIMPEKDVVFSTPREAFAALIDNVSGKGTWERNPWVFAYSFERVD